MNPTPLEEDVLYQQVDERRAACKDDASRIAALEQYISDRAGPLMQGSLNLHAYARWYFPERYAAFVAKFKDALQLEGLLNMASKNLVEQQEIAKAVVSPWPDHEAVILRLQTLMLKRLRNRKNAWGKSRQTFLTFGDLDELEREMDEGIRQRKSRETPQVEKEPEPEPEQQQQQQQKQMRGGRRKVKPVWDARDAYIVMHTNGAQQQQASADTEQGRAQDDDDILLDLTSFQRMQSSPARNRSSWPQGPITGSSPPRCRPFGSNLLPSDP
ncbi:uncharacterized protein RHO25_013142 [Cercospora beticola]|uniref:Uncharacterized protein n=1 Tax=Cercospora beticola TaxID=122368 RepID=A0ABZ0P9U1_CERBT|nr:hypothetical protein RHO25_013142 [Cercospora beticola]